MMGAGRLRVSNISIFILVWVTSVVVILGMACVDDRLLETPTARQVLERAKAEFESLDYIRREYRYRAVTDEDGFLKETEIEAIVDYHAPDRKHTKSSIKVTSGESDLTLPYEDFWIGRTYYRREGEDGVWHAVIVPDSVLPERIDALDVILSNPELLEKLELDIVNLPDGEEAFKVSLVVRPGIDIGFREPDQIRQLAYWITPDDFLIRRISYKSGSPPPAVGTSIIYVLSNHNVPIEIIPPDVTPVPLPAQ